MGYDKHLEKADIGVISPIRPYEFWNKIYHYCEETDEISKYKIKVFGHEDNSECEELYYNIQLAIESGVSVLIIAAPNSEKVKRVINEISKKIFVILLEEYLETDDCCFVGEDSLKNAYEITKKYFEHYPESKQFIIVRSSSHASENRVRGIESALKELDKPKPIILDIEVENTNNSGLWASILARNLEKYKNIVDCVCAVNSFAYSSCMAVKKLKSKRDIHCIGFEAHKMNKKYIDMNLLKILSSQDLRKQTEMAVNIAIEFLKTGKKPSEKCVYVDNIIVSVW